jgi:hypothetical protein
MGRGLDRQHSVAPLPLLRVSGEQSFDPADDLRVLVVPQRPDEDDPCMRPVGLRPLACERHEIPAVSCDEDATIVGSKGENVFVRERSLAGQRAHVVSSLERLQAALRIALDVD